MDITDMGTYVAVLQPDGSLRGEGQGVVMTRDGETAAWSGGGIGRFTADGGIQWRGAIYYQTTGQKLARLNGTATIFEFDVDAEGNNHGQIWEWK